MPPPDLPKCNSHRQYIQPFLTTTDIFFPASAVNPISHLNHVLDKLPIDHLNRVLDKLQVWIFLSESFSPTMKLAHALHASKMNWWDKYDLDFQSPKKRGMEKGHMLGHLNI